MGFKSDSSITTRVNGPKYDSELHRYDRSSALRRLRRVLTCSAAACSARRADDACTDKPEAPRGATTDAPPRPAIPASPTRTPATFLVREQPIIDALDEWLDELFAPEHATQTAQQIVAALAHGPDRSEHIDAARRRISGARREVERCRTALRDTNTPAARREVLSWLDEAAAEKEQAELALTTATQLAPPTLSTEEIVAVVEHCGGLTGILRQATGEERTALYEAIGVSAVYDPEHNQVRLGADPVASTARRRAHV